jgi:predicted amidohydrolase
MMTPELLILAQETVRRSPAWLPDVFATLHDLLAHDSHGLDLQTGLTRDDYCAFRDVYLADANATAFADGDLSPALRQLLSNALAGLIADDRWNSPHWQTCLLATRVVDEVCALIAHERTSPSGFFSECGVLLDAGESLVRDPRVGGWVLPRTAPHPHTIPRWPKEFRDVFCNLLRPKERDDCSIRYRRVTNGSGFGLGKVPLRVGFVPVIHDPNTLEWVRTGDRFMVGVRYATEKAILKELRATLDWIATHDAALILLPELVVSERIVQEIAEWRTERPPEANPQLILAGSQRWVDADARTRNRACVIDSSGADRWRQDKMHAYLFTKEHQQCGKWEVGSPVQDLYEDIAVAPRRLMIRDIGVNRIAVAICEDFARTKPYHSILGDFGITLLLVPIMNAVSNDTGRDWIERSGISMAQESRTMSLIVNSGTLVRRDPPELDDYSGLIHHDYPTRKVGPPVAEWRDPATQHLRAVVREL